MTSIQIKKTNSSHLKDNMVNKYQEQSNYHQQRPTAMANIFHLSEHLINIMFIDNNYTSNQDAHNNISSIVNSFGINL